MYLKLNITKYRKIIVVTILIVAAGFLFTTCMEGSADKAANKNFVAYEQYADASSCGGCHKDIYEKHLHSGHYLTSLPASAEHIAGSFEPGKNVFAFDPIVNVTMEKTDSGFYQVAYRHNEEVRREKMDVIIGSGRKGQSYLSWIKDHLVQLPITYYTPAGQWSNSPGYNPHKVMFNRPITTRCLECHSTYFDKISLPEERPESFNPNKIVYGVDCQKCHGPAANHVSYQTKNPTEKQPKFIVNPGKLPRERILDLCGLCHGGALTKTQPSFQFQAGDTLANYFSLQAAAINADNIDVHGNQLGLLSLSKCFKKSQITCITCHNPHENDSRKAELFSQKCISCHSDSHVKTCKMMDTLGKVINTNCIDCHMPKQQSHAVSVYLQGNEVPTSAEMRTHFIKIYPEESKKASIFFKKLSGKK